MPELPAIGQVRPVSFLAPGEDIPDLEVPSAEMQPPDAEPRSTVTRPIIDRNTSTGGCAMVSGGSGFGERSGLTGLGLLGLGAVLWTRRRRGA